MEKRPDCILLDDDFLVHMTWKMAGDAKGRTLLSFDTPEALFAQIDNLDRDLPVYVDVSLANNVRGEQVARELHEKGFTQIYLATGYAPEHLEAEPWLRGIVGKNPPWA